VIQPPRQTALKRSVADGQLNVIPAYRPGDEDAGMFRELGYYANPDRGVLSAWKNEMATMSWFYWLTFDGRRAVSQICVPTFFVHRDGCILPDNARTVHKRVKGETKLRWTSGIQTDFYDRAEQVNGAVALAHEHFTHALRRTNGDRGSIRSF
jgi:hypothetical protein